MVKEGQWETSIDTLDPGSRQIAVEEGRDGLAGLRDLVLIPVEVHLSKAVQNASFGSQPQPVHVLGESVSTASCIWPLYLFVRI